MSNGKQCWVYWVHLAKHTDITCEGYIGITTLGVDKRFKLHTSSAKSNKRRPTRLAISIKKYGSDLKVTTLLAGSQEYCQMIENSLRPTENIGWNHSVGGSSTRVGSKNSPEHIAKFVKAATGKKRTAETVELFRINGVRQMTFEHPWLHPYANKLVWLRVDEIHRQYSANPAIGRRSVGAVLNLPPDSVQKPLTKLKSGWIPSKDGAWLAFKENNKEFYDTQTI